jgi:hypothetical protein
MVAARQPEVYYSEEERRQAEQMLRDSKRLFEEGLLSETDFNEVKLRAVGAFLWQRGGTPSATPNRQNRHVAASANRESPRAFGRGGGGGGGADGSSSSSFHHNEGCCPAGHVLQPYLPPNSLQQHFPEGAIHFTEDEYTHSSQRQLLASRHHMVALGADYGRDWDFLIPVNCSACGAEVHSSQVGVG